MPGEAQGGWAAGPVLAVAVAAFAAAQFATGRPVASLAWLAIAPLLGSLVLRPLRTVLLPAGRSWSPSGLPWRPAARPGG